MEAMNEFTPGTGRLKRFGMRCRLILLAAMFTCAGIAGHAKAEDTPQSMSQLWKKASAYKASHHWVPGRLVQHELTYDLRGRLEENRRIVIGYSPGGQNHIRKNLLAAEENGKDIAWQVRAAMEDSVTLDELVGDSPFSPAIGQQVSSHFNGKRRTIKGRVCYGFEYLFVTEKSTIEGIAWLEQQTGLPAEVHSQVISVPFMQGSVKISSYMKSEYYTLTDQGDCLLERTQVEMDVAVPRLWFKGQVKLTNVCKDHWKFIFAQQHHAVPQTLRLTQSLAIH
jgi:hypothetical protein